jgi:hypothetical protein
MENFIRAKRVRGYNRATPDVKSIDSDSSGLILGLTFSLAVGKNDPPNYTKFHEEILVSLGVI